MNYSDNEGMTGGQIAGWLLAVVALPAWGFWNLYTWLAPVFEKVAQ